MVGLFDALGLDALQKAHVVGIEQADVVYAIFVHGLAFDAHAEGETAEHGWVISAILQHN